MLLTIKYQYIPLRFSNSDLYCHFSLVIQSFCTEFLSGLGTCIFLLFVIIIRLNVSASCAVGAHNLG
jgi:hypothetical protein